MTIPFDLTAELLKPVVARLLSDESVSISSFEVVALKPGAGNPTSLGVYRVLGLVATEAQDDISFSVVVKHLGDGSPQIDSSAPESWNYWRREIELFESDIVERIPSHIRYPRYLGQSVLNDGTALFWNADLGDLAKSTWSWEQCLEAAALAADLNAMPTDGFERFEWLNRNQVAGWGEFEKDWLDPYLDQLRAEADSQASLKNQFDAIWPFYIDRSIIELAMSAGRQGFTHTDFNLNNLMPEAGGIIVLDWQLAGMGRIGSDVASIFNTAFELDVIEATRPQFEQLCAVYTQRFNEISSQPIDLNEVRLAVAITGVFILRWMSFFVFHMKAMATETTIDFEGLVEHIAKSPMGVYAQVLHELGL